ncbi:hypothetical protein [Mycoplasmopsis cynos]
MMFSLKGIPCIYYGEEIGMLNVKFNNRSEFRDVDIKNGFAALVDNMNPEYSEDEFIKYLNINSRDAGRGLMQWNKTKNAGFSKSTSTWIKNGRNKEEINVSNALKNKDSIFYFYKELINYRKSKYHNVLIYGKSDIYVDDNGVIVIKRYDHKTTLIAYINPTKNELKLDRVCGEQILSTYKDKKITSNKLRPFESVLIKL